MDAGGDPGVRPDLEPERVEVDDAVGAERDLGPRPARSRASTSTSTPAISASEVSAKYDSALDDDGVADLPAQPEPRHLRVAVAVEVGVVAADGQHELAGQRALPPEREREAAGEPDVLVEQPGVVGELAPAPERRPRGWRSARAGASSIDTSAASGRGSAIRARPSRLISRPSPNDTASTAMPSTRAKQVNEMPAANQNVAALRAGSSRASRAARPSGRPAAARPGRAPG